MNKTIKTIIICVISAILLFILTICSFIFLVIKNVDKQGNKEFYTIGNDTFPSITSVVGKRKTSSISTSKKNKITTKSYTYTDIKNVQSDLDQYIAELKSNNFLTTSKIDLNKTKDTFSLAKVSNDNDYIIVVNITYDLGTYTIEIKKGIGSLTQFE